MGNKKAENFLINLNWEKDIFEDFDGNYNDTLAGKRLVYLFKSMKEIMLKENGKQVRSGDIDIDYPVRSIINQLQRMRGEDINLDPEIAYLRFQGLSSTKISEELELKGVSISPSGVRKRNGWLRYQDYLLPGEI